MLSRLLLVCHLCCSRKFNSFSRSLFSETLWLELVLVLVIFSLERCRESFILLKIGIDTFYQNFLFQILQSEVIVQIRSKDILKQIILNPLLLFLYRFPTKLLDELLQLKGTILDLDCKKHFFIRHFGLKFGHIKNFHF